MALLNGTMFFDYSFAPLGVEILAAEVLGGLVFIAMYSILLTLLLLAVRNELSHIKVHYYLREMVQKFFLTVFIYFVLLSLAFVAVVSIGTVLGISLLWTNLVLFILSLSLIFVPQSLVIDEKPIVESIRNNWYVIQKHPMDFLLVVLLSTIAVGALHLIEAGIDHFVYAGRYITVLLMFGIVVPFIEILKTILYMNRFELVRGHEYAKRKHPGLKQSK